MPTFQSAVVNAYPDFPMFQSPFPFNEPAVKLAATNALFAILAAVMASAFIDAYRNSSIQIDEGSLLHTASLANTNGDMFTWMKYRNEALYTINPHERRYGVLWRKFDSGWYIPDGWLMPLGDNRDNSRDGRYFGPVSLDNVLGKAMFKYWPLQRMGKIE